VTGRPGLDPGGLITQLGGATIGGSPAGDRWPHFQSALTPSAKLVEPIGQRPATRTVSVESAAR
jgi:hypothetical protein